MDRETWERWADKIDEARSRESCKDLEYIAYQILNSCILVKEEKDDGLVVCSESCDYCPDNCNHRFPHKARFGQYDEEKHMYCSDKPSECGWRTDEPMCVCK